MANSCFTSVCFSGDPYNIYKLSKDIQETLEWSSINYSYWNINYFFNINGVDLFRYNKSHDHRDHISVRSSIVNFKLLFEYPGSMNMPKLYVGIDSAWDIDYGILSLISMIYNLEFSAYSEEPNLDVFEKCRNGKDTYFDYDYAIRIDIENDKDFYRIDDIGLGYINPCKSGDEEASIIKQLKDNNFNYEKEMVTEIDPPLLYGIYYDEK